MPAAPTDPHLVKEAPGHLPKALVAIDVPADDVGYDVGHLHQEALKRVHKLYAGHMERADARYGVAQAHRTRDERMYLLHVRTPRLVGYHASQAAFSLITQKQLKALQQERPRHVHDVGI